MKKHIDEFNKRLNRLIIYEIFMVTVSLLIVLFSLIDLFVNFNESTIHLIINIDYIICIIFGLDLIISLYRANNKIKCLKSSIITVLAIIPFSTFFRIAGVLRISRVFLLFQYATPTNVGALSSLWIFIMRPSVIRISKFGNMARSYFFNPRKKHD
ncbi:hypothetical protein [Serpentinicella alkaliphila]|uniref:Uncharacterized protein n=1 Tax=Serpentinicella alkaliphila TaxID=1734049 RepID=A0A4R2T8Z3_9FIRM|nr:hypothetical protein [Serpentinicella alkaliphila]QUH25512.1 hypothetical protein HZR23_06870 [Serpentinicella alkaliphila]TCP99699.1 hypothetical protein EDD79_103534 [Serpentinicella alkaliphila]